MRGSRREWEREEPSPRCLRGGWREMRVDLGYPAEDIMGEEGECHGTEGNGWSKKGVPEEGVDQNRVEEGRACWDQRCWRGRGVCRAPEKKRRGRRLEYPGRWGGGKEARTEPGWAGRRDVCHWPVGGSTGGEMLIWERCGEEVTAGNRLFGVEHWINRLVADVMGRNEWADDGERWSEVMREVTLKARREEDGVGAAGVAVDGDGRNSSTMD